MKDAVDLLRRREGKIAEGVPVTPKVVRVTFEDAVADLLTNPPRTSGPSASHAGSASTWPPYVPGRRVAEVTTSDVRAFGARRQKQDVVHHGYYEALGREWDRNGAGITASPARVFWPARCARAGDRRSMTGLETGRGRGR